jgi:hypothetical protein
MDETDTGTANGPQTTSAQTTSAEAARQWAEQQRAAARAHFSTPSWIGPTRDPSAPYVPGQVEPEHDELDVDLPVTPATPADPIPDTAHWAQKTGSRLVAGTILLAALAGTIAFLVLAITAQSVPAIAGLAACALVAVIFRGALMGSGITTVDLKGSIMRIRKGGVIQVVDLSDPVHRVELVDTPDRSSWRLRLEAVDGRIIELGPKDVDPVEVHRIVTYYREIAERARRDRERRFNR